MSPGFFITGTDTEVGKTRVTLAVMAALQVLNKQVVGMKPVASGCSESSDGLRSDDALQIIQQASTKQKYTLVNPYAFAAPIAPHIAAQNAGVTIDLNRIISAYRALQANADIVVVEGVGGWRVPLGDNTTLSDMVRQLGLPVIMVVGLRLGCINHALLTAEAIRADGIEMIGWVANRIEPEYVDVDATLDTLRARLNAPLIGTLAYEPVMQSASLSQAIVLPVQQ